MLVCASCAGGADGGKVSTELVACEAGFANEGGQLVCDKIADMAAAAEEAVAGDEAEADSGDKQEL